MRRLWQRMAPVLLLTPSIVAILVFVYGFVGWTAYVSTTRWSGLIPDFRSAGLANYIELLRDVRFQSDLRNTLFFTVLFIAACLAIGLGLAWLVDRKLRGATFFRNLYLFPMSLSFVVTAVAWQWLMNPATGVNLLLKALGVEDPPLWYVSTRIIPGIEVGQIQFGLPLALVAVVIAAVWQMSGFAMAIYLAGLQGIPEDVREAARVDGATEWQLLYHILLPLLRPMTISIVILLAHVSLKTFDLVFTMTGPGAGFVTDLPGIYMFQATFRGNYFAKGAAIATVMAVISAVITVPYLVSQARGDKLGAG